MNQYLQHIRSITRRHFFQATGFGFGAMALQSLLARETSANPQSAIRNPQSAIE